MFSGLSSKLNSVFEGLRGKGVLTEEDVNKALREVRLALLDADVALSVAKVFIERVKEKAIGQEVLRSIQPGQQVVKIVNDELVSMLGNKAEPLKVTGDLPLVYLMVGLQGAGKTTTSGKLAKRLQEREGKKVLLASLDTRRPAAQEQLRILANQVKASSLPNIANEQPLSIAKRAIAAAKMQGVDVVILDTAGRLAIDIELMAEVRAIRDITTPHETLLVVDAMAGQDAVTVGKAFHETLNLSGIIMTRIDGDARGGAALSMRQVTGCPIKLIGEGEDMNALDVFHPERIAGRILGMGDVVSLVEKAQAQFAEDEAKRMSGRMKKGQFDLNDLKTQLEQLGKMGGMGALMGMLPGMNKKMKQAMGASGIDDKAIKHQIAMIQSMTPKERAKPEILKASRKRRIAAGSGTSVQDLNKLLKQFDAAAKMMKQMKKQGGFSPMAAEAPLDNNFLGNNFQGNLSIPPGFLRGKGPFGS